jgi:hypothetical protein
MPAIKPATSSPNENETLRRHRAMYERRLRELARTADADESCDEDHTRSNHRPADVTNPDSMAVA